MRLTSLLAFVLILAASNASLSTAAAKPNFVVILTDDQGWSQLSAAIDPRLPDAKSDYLATPRMNELMQNGMRFTSGYSPAPLCTPTRRCIQCGTTAARSGSEFVSKWVPADHLTIPKALKSVDSAYRCAHFGKWGEKMISSPADCGYDVSDGPTGNIDGGTPASLGVNGGHAAGPPHFVDNKDPKRTKTVTDRAVAFAEEQANAGEPFYLQVSYYAVHLSVVASAEAIGTYEAKGTPDRKYTPAWAAMLDELDQGVGRISAAIDRLGLSDSTYIIFTADNGGRSTVPGGDNNRADTNTPLTGAKHSLLEGGIRVPFIVCGPGVEAGAVCHRPVCGYDILPTVFALAGGSGRPSNEVDGVDISPLFADATAKLRRPKQALFFHRPNKLMSAVRLDDDKLFVTWNRNGKVRERSLVDVSLNPTEQGRDSSPKRPERAATLEALLLAHLKDVDAETPPASPKRKRKKPKQK